MTALDDIVQKYRLDGDASGALDAYHKLIAAQDQVKTSIFGTTEAGEKAIKKLVEAQDAFNKSLQHTPDATEKIVGSLGRMAGAVGVVGGVLLSLERDAVETFGAMEQGLFRIQHVTGATAHAMEEVKETLHRTAIETGIDVEVLADQFRNFVAVTGMESEAASKIFKDIATAAMLAGVSVETVGEVAGRAINNLKIPVNELSTVLGTMEGRLTGNMKGFASVFGHIAVEMERMGAGGKKAAEGWDVLYQVLVEKLGKEEAAGGLRRVFDFMNSVQGIGMMGGQTIKDLGGALPALEKFIGYLESMNAFDPHNVLLLNRMLGGDQGLAAAFTMLRNAIRDGGLEEAEKKIKSMADEAKKWHETWGALIGQIQSIKKELFDLMGEKFMPTEKWVLNVILSTLKQIKGEHIDWQKLFNIDDKTMESLRTMERWANTIANILNKAKSNAGSMSTMPGASWGDWWNNLWGGHPQSQGFPDAQKQSYSPGQDFNRLDQYAHLRKNAAFTPGAGELPWAASAGVPPGAGPNQGYSWYGGGRVMPASYGGGGGGYGGGGMGPGGGYGGGNYGAGGGGVYGGGRTGGGGAGAGGGVVGGGGADIYNKLLEGFKGSGLVGQVPPDGARFGITTGSAEEWARFGAAVAHAESSFNPNASNLGDPGGSHGIFQYAHGQVPGGNAHNVDASIAAFIRDSQESMRSGRGLGGGILGRRFSTIGSHPGRIQRYLNDRYGADGGLSSDGTAGSAIMGARNSPSGQPPAAFIMHNTAGRGGPRSVVEDWRRHRPGVGTQYIMDREGNIHDVRSEFGYSGTGHMQRGWGAGTGLSNRNTVGMEIVAKNDRDITEHQSRMAERFISEHYPNTPVFGHGEVNPGHREASEAMSAVNRIRSARAAGRGGKAGGGADDVWTKGAPAHPHVNLPDVKAWRSEIERPIKMNISPPSHQIRRNSANEKRMRDQESRHVAKQARHQHKGDIL